MAAKRPSFHQLAHLGFIFQTPNGMPPRDWIDDAALPKLARDAALVTTPNTAIPVEFLAYYDPTVVEILTATRNAREIFSEVKKGDWTTAAARFRATEITGATEPYSDYGSGAASGVNYTWPLREQYVFQTTIQYGDFEEAVSAEARIRLASDKQKSAATILDIDANRFYLLGVQGRDIYGILNSPDLLPAMAPTTGAGGLTWDVKTTREIYGDILALFQQLVSQSMGWIDKSSPLTLVVSPASAVQLGKATDFNVSVQDMLDRYFSSLKIVSLPELAVENNPSGELAMLFAKTVAGNPVGELAYSEKVRAGRVIPALSSFSQKWVSTTYGAIIYYPFSVASMRGIA
jgi:hypothetical protein